MIEFYKPQESMTKYYCLISAQFKALIKLLTSKPFYASKYMRRFKSKSSYYIQKTSKFT